MSKSKSAPLEAERAAAPLPQFRVPYGPRFRVSISFDPDTDRTQQSFKDECDINVLMRRYEKTGFLPGGREPSVQFGDVTGFDFADSMNMVAAVRGSFSQLPARVRARFDNNPELLLEFLADPANQPEAVKLGLAAENPPESPKSDSPGGVEGVVSTPPGKSTVADPEKPQA